MYRVRLRLLRVRVVRGLERTVGDESETTGRPAANSAGQIPFQEAL